jgi:PAS domain S-box-containing protein
MSKVTPNFSEYRTVGEAAEFLGVTPATLRNWDRAGKLKPRRHPQNGYRIYLHEELEALLRTSGLSAADRGELAPRIDWSQFGESEHFIQLYETDDFLCDAVGGFVGAALGAGHCGILIATAEHRCGIEKRLTEYGISPEAAVEERRFVALNAAETLSRIMVNGSPSPRRFHEVIGGIIQEMSRSGRRVHAFGEMVALLWADNNREAALRLEELWCELGRACKFALCCGYPLAAFSGCDDGASFDGVCRSHSRVLPSDSYSTVNDPFDRLRTISRLQQQAMSLEAEIAHRHEAEKVLRHRERELADFFENATEGLQKVAPDGRILWANKAVLSMLGYEPEEFIGRRFAEFHVDQDAVAEMMRRLSSGRNLINQESQLRCSDGTIRDVLISSNACFEDGQFVYSRCFTRDVTEIRRADRDRALLAAIVESSQDAIVTKTLDGIIRSWNAGATRLFGYTESEAVNQPITLIIPPEKFAEESQILERLRRGEQVDHFETVRVAKGGRRIDVSLTVSPLRDQNGMLIGASKVARDIGERRRAHAALRASEDRYRRLAELLPVAVYTCESESGTITYFNNKAAELWGRAPQLGDIDATFCGSQELYLPDGTFLPHDQCPMAVALREGRAFRNQEVVIRRPDGSRIVALVNIDPILSPDGEVVGAVNVFHDVSALKLAEESLREQKENLQTLLETLPVAVFIAADRECRRISGNHAALQLLRLPAGANLSKTADPEEQPVNFRVLKRGQEIAPQNLPIQRAARGETVLAEEVDHEFSDGAMVNTIVSAKPLYALDGQPRGAVACMLDVSDLKQAEIALREAAERKDAFLAVLAHELRNPLAPIRN